MDLFKTAMLPRTVQQNVETCLTFVVKYVLLIAPANHMAYRAIIRKYWL